MEAGKPHSMSETNTRLFERFEGTGVDSLTFTNRREFVVESSVQTGPSRGSYEQMTLIAGVLDVSANVKAAQSDHCRVRRLFGPTTCLWFYQTAEGIIQNRELLGKISNSLTVLADEVQRSVAIGVAPEPPFRSVESGAVLVSAGQVPERNGHLFASDPFPRVSVLVVAHGAHPVLGRDVAPVPAPQFPADEALQRGVAVVDEGSPACTAELQRLAEVERLAVVENVALSVVRSGGAGRLVPEHGAPLDRQRLVGVDERLADRQRTGRAHFEVHGDKRAGHRRVARQEQRLAFLQQPGEAVADRVCAQIRPIISHPDDYRRWFIALNANIIIELFLFHSPAQMRKRLVAKCRQFRACTCHNAAFDCGQ